MTLRKQQSAFLRNLAQLITWAFEQGYELTLGEGFIQNPRKNRAGVSMADGVHKVNSFHYKKLAQDLNLFVANKWVTDGNHPAWLAIAARWKELGGSGCYAKDRNHLSFGE